MTHLVHQGGDVTISIAATLPAQLAKRIADDPGGDFIAVGGDWLTAAQIRDRALRLATGLCRIGVRPGDRIASIMPNRIEAAELLFACAELGAVSVPLNIYPMSILYTSGTTGLPKGCMITHGYMLHWPKAHLMFDWFKPSDTSISTLPLYGQTEVLPATMDPPASLVSISEARRAARPPGNRVRASRRRAPGERKPSEGAPDRH
jgi:acyl-CoA synthetase (AMP-forming)/AMP-acid ligase II